ncbi:beta-galactosidase [Eubacteriales bacterium OttesenSCG-928-A19]|nr:beta-galactosidase [Eubacteriales bacterium OttesenSCG-928-A19]
MSTKVPMQFPYGAVYFRKSNPPREDWARDYGVAQEDGLNIMRHWFMWGAIETAPGVYDWADYDAHMDLAAKHGIKVIIAEFMDAVPEWLYYDKPELFYRRADGSIPESGMGASCPAGGFYVGPCLDNPESKRLGGAFLRALAERYKGHPALLGYDIWNEQNYAPDVCYCDHTKAQFRLWLQRKYGTLQALGAAWCRYSYSDWAQVMPPKELDFYAQSLDWLLFRKDNLYDQMTWRVEQIRAVDPDCLIAAHGTAATIDRQALQTYDEWAAAERVELYGLTYVPCRHTGDAWKYWGAVDLTRAGARGKTFWHAEMQGGPLWLQPQVLGRPKEDARIPTPEDVRLYNLTSIACGARGILYPRWRPLLNGPLFGAFGPYSMDGSRTDRSEVSASIAKWTNDPANADVLQATPMRGEVGILMLPEAQMGSYLLSVHGGRHAYGASVWGAYRAFFDNNIQADYVHLDDIDAYKALYLPYSVLMTSAQAERIAAWVHAGGTLISEGCPGYFNGSGFAGTVQPNLGFDRVFGALEDEVEFTPDILDDLQFECMGLRLDGSLTLESYRPTTGTVVGTYLDGRVAAIENSYGAGKALLIGTHPAEAYARKQGPANRAFFQKLLAFAGLEQRVQSSREGVHARMQLAENKQAFLWVLNVTNEEKEVELTLAQGIDTERVGRLAWGAGSAEALGNHRLRLRIPRKDAMVFELIR